MTLKEQDTLLVQLAIQQTGALLALVSAKDPDFVIRELFFNTWSKFRENDRRLFSLQILEIADFEFEIRANGHAKGNLVIEVKNESQPRTYKGWLITEVKFLEENYNKLKVNEICEKLGRNRDSIFYMAQKLGLKKDLKFFSGRKKKGAIHV